VPELSLCSGNPQIAIHRLDSGSLGEGAYEVHCRSIRAAFGNSSFLDVYWNDMPPAGILLEEGSVVGPLTTLHLPGHTPGSAAFFDKEQKILFTGDTLFKNGYGRTDLPGGNEAELLNSLKRLLILDPEITVYPGHGEITKIGAERG
jgi:glyoxylase-like metal-dependent hydrolase (beta-lactamase superfamily II)